MTAETDNLFADIPPAQAMGIVVSKVWKNGLELRAPFDRNRNDKGTAFAGSIASLLTLAGWALLTLRLREPGLEPEIMVVASEIIYSHPAKQTLRAAAEIDDSELERIQHELKTRARSRARLTIALRSGNADCAAATADYALILKK